MENRKFTKWTVIIKWNRLINVVSVARIRQVHSPSIPTLRTLATLIDRIHFTIMFSVPASFRQIFWHTPVDFGVLHPHKKATYTNQRFEQFQTKRILNFNSYYRNLVILRSRDFSALCFCDFNVLRLSETALCSFFFLFFTFAILRLFYFELQAW